MRKDLCKEVNDKRWTPHQSINVPNRDTWIPIADQYNDWMFLGPQIKNRCQRLTKSEGPPFWDRRGCRLDFITPTETRKKTLFCGTRKGYFCCNETVGIYGAGPRPKPIYIFSREEKTRPNYLFTLDRFLPERMWKTDQASWRKTGALEGDVSKITLMSGYVKGRFENPVYFCYRSFRNASNLQTTLHKVSKTWCDGRWRFNFYMYANYSAAANDSKLQRLIVGNSLSKVKHSRISLKESSEFPTAFSIYGPFQPTNTDNFIDRSRIADDHACNGKAEILSTQTGIISSPNYPNKYRAKTSGSINCTWKIVGPYGAIVKISFKSMRLSPKRKTETPLVVSNAA